MLVNDCVTLFTPVTIIGDIFVRGINFIQIWYSWLGRTWYIVGSHFTLLQTMSHTHLNLCGYFLQIKFFKMQKFFPKKHTPLYGIMTHSHNIIGGQEGECMLFLITGCVLWFIDRFKESVIEERRQSVETLLQYSSYKLHLVTSAPFFEFIKVRHNPSLSSSLPLWLSFYCKKVLFFWPYFHSGSLKYQTYYNGSGLILKILFINYFCNRDLLLSVYFL